ncbi:MAG: GNAT family N-acetyltransferase [Xanthomonadaceae bacterium]|jgi:GNAT superfamily N-acetyltransferase|nr:GNAT family N-acetyltransferase [Xanthomonadaceae bacterium]
MAMIDHALQEFAHDALDARRRAALVALCSAAYEEDFAAYFDLLAGATHLLAEHDGAPVCHLAWVERRVWTGDGLALRAAYVEAVATRPDHQRRGLASRLLAEVPRRTAGFDIALLSPAEPEWYARRGWTPWRGTLHHRKDGRMIDDPDECVMYRRLARTPAAVDDRGSLCVDWRPLEVW